MPLCQYLDLSNNPVVVPLVFYTRTTSGSSNPKPSTFHNPRGAESLQESNPKPHVLDDELDESYHFALSLVPMDKDRRHLAKIGLFHIFRNPYYKIQLVGNPFILHHPQHYPPPHPVRISQGTPVTLQASRLLANYPSPTKHHKRDRTIH